MTIKSTMITLAAVAALQGGAGADDMFRLNFRATCRALGANGRLETTKLTERDIIEAATGVSNNGSKQFALIYNAATDSIQVADTNGTVITDVILFQDGVSTSDGRRSSRLAFMFVPNQTNSIGTAAINERAPTSQNGNETNRAAISGIVQFALTDDITLGQTNMPGTNGGGGVLGTLGTNGLAGTTPFGTNITSDITNGVTSTNTVENTNMVNDTNTIAVTNNVSDTNQVSGSTNSNGSGITAGTGNASNSGFFFSNNSLVQSNGLSNVRVCVGTFTATRRLENGVTTTNGVTTGGGNTNNVSGNTTNNVSGTTTNSVSGNTTNSISGTTTNSTATNLTSNGSGTNLVIHFPGTISRIRP